MGKKKSHNSIQEELEEIEREMERPELNPEEDFTFQRTDFGDEDGWESDYE